jgi:hypothetical protein
MAIPVELITAPGKYYYDLAMEELEIILNTPTEICSKYQLKKAQEKKYIPYNSSTSFKQWKK